MLSKLKYTGVSTKDLLDIYSLFIRSRAEYMSVVWHSSLTSIEEKKIENIQKTSLKIILGENYEDYPSSLAQTALKSLSERRKIGCLSFAKQCIRKPHTKAMFPLNPEGIQNVRQAEKYSVNFARTENSKKIVLSPTARGSSMRTTGRSRRRRGRGGSWPGTKGGRGPGPGGRGSRWLFPSVTYTTVNDNSFWVYYSSLQ